MLQAGLTDEMVAEITSPTVEDSECKGSFDPAIYVYYHPTDYLRGQMLMGIRVDYTTLLADVSFVSRQAMCMLQAEGAPIHALSGPT